MKFLIFCFVIFASNQLITVQGDYSGCEVTEAALAELAELRRIVGQLTTMVETLIGEPVVPALPGNEQSCDHRGEAILHHGEVRVDECTLCTCNNGHMTCDVSCPEVDSNLDERPCNWEGKPLNHLEEVRSDDCMLCTCNNGTTTCDHDEGCTQDRAEEPDELIDPQLSYTWKEALVSWTAPVDEVVGYIAKLISLEHERIEESTRLSPFETSFTSTDITPNQSYRIEITPIMSDGPGTKYTSENFTAVCHSICTFEYAPLCGTDGATYSNMCALEIAQCETEDSSLEVDYPGACDECREVICDAPGCDEGFTLAHEPLLGECCPGCVDHCTLIACDAPICPDGYIISAPAEKECCEGCTRQVFEDCSAAQAEGMTNNGAYLIQPVGVSEPFEVLCDFEHAGGRWTVILRRVDSTVDFLRDYDEYVEGFGDASDAYWIGLENIYRLNKQGNTKMAIEGTDHLGASATGNYNIFRVGNATDNYALNTIVGYSGTIGNALTYNKGAAFSAPGRDMDNGPRDCATVFAGGWWYKGKLCSRTNPLGEFLTPDEFAFEKGIIWAPFRGKGKSLQFLEIKIRSA